MKLFVLALFLFGFVCGSENDFSIIDSIVQESPCNAAGGMCTIAADCPTGNLSEQKGLCPIQRSRGIECCYGISIKETRCRKRGGDCMPLNELCNPNLTFKNATDCPGNYKCCILV